MKLQKCVWCLDIYSDLELEHPGNDRLMDLARVIQGSLSLGKIICRIFLNVQVNVLAAVDQPTKANVFIGIDIAMNDITLVSDMHICL